MSVLTAPFRFLRWLWNFVNPQLKAGRIPFARTVLVLQAAAALVFVGYTLIKKDIKLPFSSEPYLVEVIVPDAAGLDPSKEPAAGVSGAQQGRVIAVREEGGQAIATLRFPSDMEGKIFADATAELRPLNVLQILIVNVDPGDPASGPLPEGQPIEADRTTSFVHIDELTEILDADTQAQVRILISEAATALRGREPELRRIFGELGELTDTAEPIAEALDERRRLLTRLVDNLDVVFTTLGQRGSQLAETIDAGSRTLAVTTAREGELAAAVRRLAPTTIAARDALAKTRALAEPLVPALDQLLPVLPQLEPASEQITALIPEASEFLTVAEQLADEGAEPVRLFRDGTKGLADRVKRDLIPAISNFGTTIDALDKYKGGIAQTADLWSGAFSQIANNGPYTQVWFGGGEITPEGLGLGPAAARARQGRPTRLAMMLAEALELNCRETNPAGCLFRFGLEGLPEEPVLAPEKGSGG